MKFKLIVVSVGSKPIGSSQRWATVKMYFSDREVAEFDCLMDDPSIGDTHDLEVTS